MPPRSSIVTSVVQGKSSGDFHPVSLLTLHLSPGSQTSSLRTVNSNSRVFFACGPLLGFVAVLIQKHEFKDEKRPALAMGPVVVLLTAIPAPLTFR
jgi:hypothetical protein